MKTVGEIALYNINSSKMIAIDKASTADGAAVVLQSDATTTDQRWTFVPQDNGYFQIVASQSKKCLGVTDTAKEAVEQQSCAGGPNQQWRYQPMNNGTIRLVARPSGKVLEVANCLMADGAKLRQWVSLNNPCQSFRIAMPGD